MKRAALFAALLALASPAFAQVSDVGGPITSQAERDATAQRVRGGASCAGCDLFQIDLAYRNVSGRDFHGSRIRQADLTIAIADRTNFAGANLSLANLFGLRATRANFAGANLSGATLVGAHLGGARMTGAVLTGANASGAEMADAVGLTQDQLNTACGDATTTLPAGMTIPRC
ncbi:MAG: pentapeptide repeat-containing protein [Hyphomonadaceae bacterium]|nr:pentapeptide repeat-containing protein [Hyphomonadaceae bacterium]